MYNVMCYRVTLRDGVVNVLTFTRFVRFAVVVLLVVHINLLAPDFFLILARPVYKM